MCLGAGATAVLLGRPVFFSLAVGGEDGVLRMLSIIREELEAAMALCGCQVHVLARPLCGLRRLH